jgi:hypothetical protein
MLSLFLIVTAVFAPDVAMAQQNYVLLPSFYVGGGGGNSFIWTALVVSYKDGKVYLCTAQLPTGENISLRCNPQSFAGKILTGSDVVTMSPRNVSTLPSVNTDFWQLDQQSGAVQLCKTAGYMPDCASFQLP